MAESKMKVSIGFLEASCLKGTNAWIDDVEVVRRGDGSKYLLLSLRGPDVPEAETVVAIVSQTTKLEPC
jgi:hypothetical protein